MEEKEFQKRSDFDSKDGKKTRCGYFLQCAFEYSIFLLMADAFLATLLAKIGISDSLNGIISTMVSLAFLFQFFTIFLDKKIRNTKRASVILKITSFVFFMLVYLVPFSPFSKTVKTVLVTLLILGGYVCNYIIDGILYRLVFRFVDPNKRGKYIATNEMISTTTSLLLSLFCGYVFNRFLDSGNEEGGFVFVSAVILVLTAGCFLSLLCVKSEDSRDVECVGEEKRKVLSDIKHLFGDKNFVRVVIAMTFIQIATWLTNGFMGVYKIKELAISLVFVQVINIAASLARVGISRPFGAFVDRTSPATGMCVAMLTASLAFGLNIFSSPDMPWFVVAYTVIYQISLAGLQTNSNNMLFRNIDAGYIVEAISIKESIGGLCGFFASLAGSKILEIIQSNENKIFGITVYAQQFLSLISTVLWISAAVFVYFAIIREEKASSKHSEQ